MYLAVPQLDAVAKVRHRKALAPPRDGLGRALLPPAVVVDRGGRRADAQERRVAPVDLLKKT